jgi:FtsP/CotA-like multicopper oxidase with cupredoxin domain
MRMFEDSLPLNAFDGPPTFTAHAEIRIRIEPRRVKFSDAGRTPAHGSNAWRYVRVGSKEDNNHTLDVALGPVFNVRRGVKLDVCWENAVGPMPPMGANLQRTLEPPPINPIPMQYGAPVWAGMNPSVGVVTHLHGARVQAASDGWPLHPASFPGNPYGFESALPYSYTNDQRSCMLWFHDHAMDNTAVQVHAGLAGLYFVRDAADDEVLALVGGAKQEIPLVLQDRKFACGFEGIDYWAGVPTFPDDFDRSEYLGDTIFVNGRPSPFHEVERKVYRLRLLNGSHARTFALALVDPSPWSYLAAPEQSIVGYTDLLTVIGNDGGLFPKAHRLGPTDHVLLAPGERLDLLLDLTGLKAREDDMGAPIPMRVLRLVNLAVASAQAGDWPEAIFQTTEELTGFPKPASAGPNDPAPSVASSMLALDDSSGREKRRALLASIAAIRVANVLEFCVDVTKASSAAVDEARLSHVLGSVASEDGFEWRDGALQAPNGATIVQNRFVVLMNDTLGIGFTPNPKPGDSDWNPYALGSWRDTQVWELSQANPNDGRSAFSIPFSVDLDGSAPPPGSADAAKDYFVTRASWFDKYPPERLIDDAPAAGEKPGYAQLHAPAAKPKAGTYERWYVANVGNAQPLLAGVVGGDGNVAVPDMHPFHMHLVNFVVTDRWRLQADTNRFVRADKPRANDFDKLCRHDTVRVQSNELLELLVYFPRGYTGCYPFHCHVLEHEDMGMMSHFEVVP